MILTRFQVRFCAIAPLLCAGAFAMPANDSYVSAEEILVDAPLPLTATGDTTGATVEAGELALVPGFEASVWYRVTSPATGAVVIDTEGASIGTQIAVVVGGSLTGGELLAYAGPSGEGAELFLATEAGETYHIGVGGAGGQQGTIVLNLKDPYGGVIAGRVTAETGGAPLAEVEVRAYEWRAIDEVWSPYPAAAVETNGRGDYIFGGLTEGGSFRLEFVDAGSRGLATEYFGGTPLFGKAAVLSPGELLGTDFQMAAGGAFVGEIRSEGVGLAGLVVDFFVQNSGTGEWERVRSVETGAGGVLPAMGLPDATYRVGVRDPAGVYLPSFYGGAGVETAQDYPMAGAAVMLPLLEMQRGGEVSGVVRDAAAGGGLGGVSVIPFVYDGVEEEWKQAAEPAVSAADGSYVLLGLPDGDYRIGFVRIEDGAYAAAFHGGGLEADSATPVVISPAGRSFSGIDQSLDAARIVEFAPDGPGGWRLVFSGNPFAPYQFETSEDLIGWTAEGGVFRPEGGSFEGRVELDPALGAKFWRVVGPEDLGLSPDPAVHERSSYHESNLRYRWEDRRAREAAFLAEFGGAGGFLSAWGFGDFNGDGEEDFLAFPGQFLSLVEVPVILHLSVDTGSRGDGRLLFNGEVPGALHPRKLLIGDLNGDGVDDAVLADHGYDADPFPGAPLRVLRSTGDGRIEGDVYPEWTSFHHAAALGDTDHDGDLDLFLANSSGTPHQLLLNDGTGRFHESRQLVGTQWTGHVWASEFFDLDGDGFLDLATGGVTDDGEDFIRWGSGRGTYGDDALDLGLEPGWNVYDFEAADFDGDGDRDLVVLLVGEDFDRSRVRFFLNEGGRSFVDETLLRFDAASWGAASGQWIDFLFTQDVDEDGDLDLVTDASGVLIGWENDGEARFTRTLIE